MSDHTIQAFTKGTQNLLVSELIATDAAQDSRGWLTRDGKIMLSYGREVLGNESTVFGKISGIWFGYKTDGTQIMYKKISTKIQYLLNGTWTDCITGLTADADYSFANYASLAGAFTFVAGVDGIWKIVNANPGNPINMTSSAKNFCGRILIDKSRMLLWNRPQDKTGLYYSFIDPQNATVYTSVTGEATASLGGTLAFKAGGTTRCCFGVTITLTVSGEVFTDLFNGVLKGSLGNSGTINYVTGVYTISVSGVGTVAYQWEDSNVKGLTDFTHSSTRLAGEGGQFSQDAGGDAILNVLIGQDGSYYSLKSQSSYVLTFDDTDLAATNILYRQNLGIMSYRAAISTNKGIAFINTANVMKPEMTILQKSLVTNNVEPVVLFPEYKFSNWDYTDCSMDTWERYVIVQCKTIGAVGGNDTVLLCDMTTGTVDAVSYEGRCSATDYNNNLFFGSNVTENVYQMFTGFDDNGSAIVNYWKGKSDQYQMAVGMSRALRYQIGERLKKYRKQKIKGMISPSQSVAVYVNPDNSGWQLVGTILGTGSYVDYSATQAIGKQIGQFQIGGDNSNTYAYPFFTEIKTKIPYFRTRAIQFIALGIGYVDIQLVSDWDIIVGVERLPTRFRQKQNVSLDGKTDNLTET